MEPLLTTKFYFPPLRPGHVPRPRLVAQLNERLRQQGIFGRKLTLVSAPAGYGKTTLVSAWLQGGRPAVTDGGQAAYRCAWLSLDEDDNDPARFLAYLITAISQGSGRADPPGKTALSMLGANQPPPSEAILTSLINAVAAQPESILLVLDDYHLIEAQPIHAALSYLLEHLTSQLHLVVVTREDPLLPLARLRARGQLAELRAADLRFSSKEVAQFLNQTMGLGLSPADITALETRTEGWIAGLQLAALTLQGRADPAGRIQSFAGSHRFVMDYLIEEVLQQQPQRVQEFLLRTAVLDRLTGALCDALTGQNDSQATLETLDRSNLFLVPLDGERRWYRYHHLFADLLHQRLRQTRPEQIPELHVRASEWHEAHGSVDEAVEHALRAEDTARAGRLIAGRVDALWQRGELPKMGRWLDALPEWLVFSMPRLCIFKAWHLFTSGQLDEAEECLQACERELGAHSSLAPGISQGDGKPQPTPGGTRLTGRAAAIRAFLASHRGDVPGIIQHGRQALELLPASDLAWRSATNIALGDAYSFQGDPAAANEARREVLEESKATGNLYMILIGALKLAVTLRQQGLLRQSIEICERHVQLASDYGLAHTELAGGLMAIWGEALAELNDLDGARARVREGSELSEGGGDVAILGWSSLCLVRVLFSGGEWEAAEAVARKMRRTALESHVPPWITNRIAAWEARLWLEQDRLGAASQWMEGLGLDPEGELQYLHEKEYVTFARIQLAHGKPEEALSLLERLREDAIVGQRTSSLIEIQAVQALGWQAGGDLERALEALERALGLAEPLGFVRTFVDEGPPMAQLLNETLSRGLAAGYARQVLSAFPALEPEPARPSPPRSAPPGVIEPLSPRELEVLQLVAEGLTNQEIAARLYLSQNTVKVHTRNIYGKLDVHSRTQAVARSQELGLLQRG